MVTNGRLVRLDANDEPLVPEDFQLLALYSDSAQAAQKVTKSHLLFFAFHTPRGIHSQLNS